MTKWVFGLWARSFRLVWVPDKFELELIRAKWWFCSTKWSSEVTPLGHFALRRLFFPQLRPHFDHRTGVDSKWSSDQLSFGGTKGHSGHFRRDLRRAQIWKLLKASQYFITKCNYLLVLYFFGTYVYPIDHFREQSWHHPQVLRSPWQVTMLLFEG